MRLRHSIYLTHNTRLPGTCTAFMLAIMMLVFLNPCLIYCVVTQHATPSDARDQTRLSVFLCQLASVTPSATPNPNTQHHSTGTTPLNETASILRSAYEYLPHVFFSIGVPAILLAFLAAFSLLPVVSFAATPPTPPPRLRTVR